MPKQKAQTTTKKNHLPPTQLFLPLSEIRDSIVVLKNGGLRAVMQVSAVNFNLKSEEEQQSLVYSYQSFLNTLDFEVQIVVRSKKLDIDAYKKSIDKNKSSHPYEKESTGFTIRDVLKTINDLA